MFSRRTAHDATTNALTRALAQAREGARGVIDLTVSNPTRAGIPYAREAILRAFQDARMLEYAPEPFGLMHAREAVAEDMRAHGLAIATDRVVLTASTSEAYAFLFKLLCDPGDQVLVPQPSYPLFEHLAAFESVTLVPYALAYDGEWHVEIDSVRRAVGPRTRALMVVSPNNPTGSYLKREELEALASLGLPIISDEVFARYPLMEDVRRVTSVLEAAPRAGSLLFALGGLSKLAALPQMKAAWMAIGGDASRVLEALARLELVADSFLSVSTPVQHALPALLASRAAAEGAIVTRTRANLANLRALLEADKDSPATLLNAEGGWYATLRIPRTQSEESWAIELLERDGVYVHPGHFFDFQDEAHVVLSLLTPEDAFTEGASRLLARIRENAA